jgi:hypothetical protein
MLLVHSCDTAPSARTRGSAGLAPPIGGLEGSVRGMCLSPEASPSGPAWAARPRPPLTLLLHLVLPRCPCPVREQVVRQQQLSNQLAARLYGLVGVGQYKALKVRAARLHHPIYGTRRTLRLPAPLLAKPTRPCRCSCLQSTLAQASKQGRAKKRKAKSEKRGTLSPGMLGQGPKSQKKIAHPSVEKNTGISNVILEGRLPATRRGLELTPLTPLTPQLLARPRRRLPSAPPGRTAPTSSSVSRCPPLPPG